ncbi:MAG: 23S rRNA (pseudouridine(1915)-N(3))-methyltransferase RlmH [Candidatus Magasanikbacteria bacterium]
MLHINLICLGKLKESYWREAEAEYLKRLGAFAKIKIIELKEESFDEKDTPEKIKAKEAEKILKSVPENSYIIILDSKGKNFSSEQLAGQLASNLTIQQFNSLTVIIGGPLGLHESIIKIANLKLSLSSLTFTHQMARIILWEQLYRSFMISTGRKYHY